MRKEGPVRSKPVLFASLCAMVFLAPPSHSASLSCNETIEISFAEGAPVDIFTIENRSKFWNVVAVEIDLSGSKGNLIFDTSAGGQGVDVFQPYKSVSGSAIIAGEIEVKDGSEKITIAFDRFAQGQTYAFSIDVDDRLAASELGQIRVSGSEIEMAMVTFDVEAAQGETAARKQAFFGKDNRALVNDRSCSS